VVERTLAWFNRFRRLTVRYERRADIHEAFLFLMMRTPDGHGRLELTKFRNPDVVEIKPAIAPPNAPGLRSVMFAVESVDDTVARLRANGAELIGEVAQYEDKYRLCYMRGPAGIIVALAEELF
jgi:catechol 2,3-dioxygenase-like lactoylglutathione lyase family enzyme